MITFDSLWNLPYPSKLAETKYRSSRGWNAIAETKSTWRKKHKHSRRLKCHNRTVLSMDDERINNDFDQATSSTGAWWPTSSQKGRGYSGACISFRPSLLLIVDAIVSEDIAWWNSLNRRVRISFCCFDGLAVIRQKSLKRGSADLRTQTFSKLSCPPVARRWPSGENLIETNFFMQQIRLSLPHAPDGSIVSVNNGLQQLCFVKLRLFFEISWRLVFQISIWTIVDQ